MKQIEVRHYYNQRCKVCDGTMRALVFSFGSDSVVVTLRDEEKCFVCGSQDWEILAKSTVVKKKASDVQ